MNLGTETGSLINHLHSTKLNPTPEIGMGATELLWTDRHAGTIVDVIANKKGNVVSVVFQRDLAFKSDKNGLSDSQTYKYFPDPDGPKTTYTWSKGAQKFTQNGKKKSFALAIDIRDEHYDYTF